MKTFLTILSFVIVASSRAEPEIKGSPAELANYLSNVPRTVAVTGEGEIKAQADRANITLKITTENKSLAEALRANEQLRGRLAAFLQDHGVASDRIRANKFSSTPKHSFYSEKVKLYRVENQMAVAARDEKELQAVTAAPDKFPEAAYVSSEFEHSNKEKLKAEAVSRACDDAEQHKTLLEQKLGLKLTPRGFSERFVGQPTIGDRPRIQGGSAPSYKGATPLPGYAEDVGQVMEAVSSFGELSFKVLVTVEYSAEPRPAQPGRGGVPRNPE